MGTPKEQILKKEKKMTYEKKKKLGNKGGKMEIGTKKKKKKGNLKK